MICALISASLSNTDLVQASNLVIKGTGTYSNEYKQWCRREQTGAGTGFDDWGDFWQEEIQIADQANTTRAQNQGHGIEKTEEQEVADFDRVMKVFTDNHEESQENMNSILKINGELREHINVLTQALNRQQATTTPQQQTMPPDMKAMALSMISHPPSTNSNQMPVTHMQQQQSGYQPQHPQQTYVQPQYPNQLPLQPLQPTQGGYGRSRSQTTMSRQPGPHLALQLTLQEKEVMDWRMLRSIKIGATVIHVATT